jgi:hypothetical protein
MQQAVDKAESLSTCYICIWKSTDVSGDMSSYSESKKKLSKKQT